MKKISSLEMQSLNDAAQHSPRLRAHLNLHPTLDDPVQRLAIAMEPGTYVRPHRHPHTWELLSSLSGRFVVLHFDDSGMVTERTVIGEDCVLMEKPPGVWHSVLSLDKGAVIFEVKQGPYVPVDSQDYAPWSPPEGSPDMARLLAWFAEANIGDKPPC
jgi:cupin fold WbuC family metalloprotein